MMQCGMRKAVRAGLITVSAVLAILATGCTRSLEVGSATTERQVPENTAYVLPPPGGLAIVAVAERTFSNGVQQDIALASNTSLPVQNAIRVRVYGPIKATAPGQTAMPEQFQPLRSVDSEMRRTVPGMAFQRAPNYVQNRYGPFGYAIGRRGNDTCIFGFQNIRSREFSWNDRGSIDIRMRVCEANTTERRLVALMYGYTVNVFVDATGWNPYGQAAAVPENFGAPGADILPEAKEEWQNVLEPTSPALTIVRQRPVNTQPSGRQPLPQPTGPTVPPPPGNASSSSTADPLANVGSPIPSPPN